MDSTQFLQLLENPFNLEPRIIQELGRLSSSHPFCQPLAYIQTRFLLEQNHPDFEASSKRAVALAVNRKIFTDYISGKLNPLRPRPINFKFDLEENSFTGNIATSQIDEKTSKEAYLVVNQQENLAKPKRSHEHIIDKFIKEEPRISQPRKDLPKENLAEKKLDPEQELVTETLAQVYIQQGFLSDAIDILKKLSVKNPEKSSYFAKKIENLKK